MPEKAGDERARSSFPPGEAKADAVGGRARLDAYRSQNTPRMLWLYAADEATLRLFDDMAGEFQATLSAVCGTAEVMLVAASFVAVSPRTLLAPQRNRQRREAARGERNREQSACGGPSHTLAKKGGAEGRADSRRVSA